MLKERERLSQRLLMGADVAVVVLAFLLAYSFRRLFEELFAGSPLVPLRPFDDYLWLLLLILPLWWLLLTFQKAYASRPAAASLWRASLPVIRANAYGLAVLTLVFFAFRVQRIQRSFIFIFAILCCLLLVGVRVGLAWWARRLQRSGKGLRHIVVVGTGSELGAIAGNIRARPETGLRLLATIDLAETGDPVGAEARVKQLLEEHPVDEVIFAVPLSDFERATKLLEYCEEVGINVRVVANFYTPSVAKPMVEEFFGTPTIYLSSAPTRLGELAVKRAIDCAVALIGLGLSLPLLAIAAIVVKLSSEGPILYRQERAGLNGRRFTVYKLRTMVKDAEQLRERMKALNEMSGPVFKIRDDPRLTPVGRWLRRWSVDELPQLVNVLRGEMSLVGPRPLPVYEAERIKGARRRRFSMKPGMTCLWQISGRSAVDFEEWMQLDLEYIDRWSLPLDLTILLRTVPAVLTARGAH